MSSPVYFVDAVSNDASAPGGIAGLDLTIPTTAKAGDLLLAAVSFNGQPDPNNAEADITTPGWTPLYQQENTGWIGYKIASSNDPGSYVNWTCYGGYIGGGIAVYRPIAGSVLDKISYAVGATMPSVTTTLQGDLVVSLWAAFRGAGSAATPAGLTTRHSSADFLVADTTQAAAGATPAQTATGITNTPLGLTAAIFAASAPNAPSNLTPSNVTLDRTQTQRFGWDYSNNASNDPQSQLDFRWRHKGTTDTWTTVSQTTPNNYWDAPGGTFPAEDIEYQVRNYDQAGLVGPWSAVTYFTAADPTGTPTITAPVSGSTIGLTPDTITWSTPAQQAYQVRRVADNNGQPDTGTIYYDTGQVTDPNTRSLSVAFETNNRAEHIQVRVQQNTLWSSWADELVHVSYTPPATPDLTVVADSPTGTITVRPTQPTPANGQPAVVSIDIWCRTATPLASSTFDNGGAFDTGPTYDKGAAVTAAIVDPQRPQGTGIRLAATLPPNTPWVDRAPASGVEYEYQIVANGSNTTTATSAWIG